MSREGTPVSLIGELAITSSPGSSNSDMPVTTRGMRQGHRVLASGAGSGPSRASAPSSRRPAVGRSTELASRRSAPPRRLTRPGAANEEDSDDDDGGGSDDGADSDDDNPEDIINEIMSTFADTHPTPAEFSTITRRGLMGSEQT